MIVIDRTNFVNDLGHREAVTAVGLRCTDCRAATPLVWVGDDSAFEQTRAKLQLLRDHSWVEWMRGNRIVELCPMCRPDVPEKLKQKFLETTQPAPTVSTTPGPRQLSLWPA